MIQNPILPGFHPDPSIFRWEDCYYIVNSSFEWFPGMPIYRSYDLKNWELYTHSITRASQADIVGVGSAQGVWAPSMSYNPDTKKFYITYSIVRSNANNNFDVDNYVIEADDIAGPWSDMHYMNSGGFDPSLFHDDDGRSYVVNLEWDYRQGYEHPGVIVMQEYDVKNHKLLGKLAVVSKGATDRGCLEGPNLFKKNGFYYLTTAEGGTGYGHAVVMARSENVWGPYMGSPYNPVLTSQPNDFAERGCLDSAKPWQYNPDSYLQKSGHGNVVETTSGEVYMSHHSSRPFSPELRSPLGRETMIQKCVWTEDNWIKLDREDNVAQEQVQEPNLPAHPFEPKSDAIYKEEDGKKVPADDCYTLREPFSEDWIKFDDDGAILMRGRESLFSPFNQSILAKVVTSFNFDAVVKMTYTPDYFLHMAGLTNYYNSSAFYYLRIYDSASLGGKTIGIFKSEEGIKTEFLEERVFIGDDDRPIYLKSQVRERALQYFYSFDGENWTTVGPVLDASTLSDEYAHGFTGSFVGITAQDLYTKSKWCKFDEFKVTML